MNPTKYPDLEPDQIGAAITAFRAENCPFCDVKKDLLVKPFCDACLELLTPKLRDDIWNRNTFLHTFHPAMAHLRKVSRIPSETDREAVSHNGNVAPVHGKPTD